MTSPTPSPDATVPGSIPAEVDAEAIARLLWERFASNNDGAWPTAMAGVYRSLAAEIIGLGASRAAPTDQPVAPGVEEALRSCLAMIDDYLNYRQDGDPWTEDARLMREMEIDWAARDGRLDAVRAALSTIPNEERIRRETAEERIREAAEDERDRLYEIAGENVTPRMNYGESDALINVQHFLRGQGAILPADRVAKRTEGAR